MTQAAPDAGISAPRLPSNTLCASLETAVLAGVGRCAMPLGTLGMLHLARAEDAVALDTLLEEWGGLEPGSTSSPGDAIVSSRMARDYRKRRDLTLVPQVGFLHFHTRQGSGIKFVHAAATDPHGQILYIWPTDYIPRSAAGFNAFTQAARLGLALASGVAAPDPLGLEDLARKLAVG